MPHIHIRRAGCAAAGLTLAAALIAAPATTASAITPPAMTSVAAQVSAASARAVHSGSPVEVLADRTDSSQTFAEPNGGFATHESVLPVRTRNAHGQWVAIDPTLTRSGGAIRPKAITVGLTLSSGGSGPLYVLTHNGASMAVSWPYGSLPAPTLSGATATYADVFPGVNLLVSATARGVSDFVEVMNATAAADPRLSRLTFRTKLAGLAFRRDAAGDLSAVSATGHAVFTAPPPQMWNSDGGTGTGIGAAPEAVTSKPAPGDRAARMNVELSSTAMTLDTSPAVLTGPGVSYPVIIDPEWDGQESTGITWLDVWKTGSGGVGGDWEPTNSNVGGIRSGVECEYSTNGVCSPSSPDSTWMTYRSYINFPISKANGLSDADFIDAQLFINESWSWTCSAKTTIDVYQTDKANQGITWNNQPAQHGLTDSADIAYGDTCPAHGVTFNAKPALSAVKTGSNLTLELRATSGDESGWHVNSWKRWDASSIDLIVYWRHAPNKPTGAVTDGVFNASTGTTTSDCAASSASPDFVDVTAPTWQANITDSDGVNGGNINGEFAWSNLTNGNTGTWDASQNSAKSGTTFTAVRNGGAPDEYKWQAFGQAPSVKDADGNNTPTLTGPSAAACYFQIDTDAPTVAPTITSVPNSQGLTYTSGVAENPVGAPAVFQLSDPTNIDPSDTTNDIVGYRYALNSASPNFYLPASAEGGTATITITPFNPQALDLYIQAVDRAGNLSPVAGPFQILTVAPVGNIATLAWWPLNNLSGSTTVDSTNNGADATLWSSGASVPCATNPVPSGYRCTLALDGSTGRAFTTHPVVGNDGSFSVSTWVDVSSCSGSCVALSQDGTSVSGFTLGYQSSCTVGTSKGACWAFTMPASDSTSAVVNAADSAPGTASTGKWTQITGVYDATHEQMQIYVNGVLAGWTGALAVLPWAATASGLLHIGSSWTSATGVTDFLPGNISAACVFYGPLAASDVTTLYNGGAGDGCGTLYATYP